MASTAHMIDIVERLTRCWDERDMEGVLGYYSEDVEYHETGSGVRINGREPLRQYLASYFKAWDTRWIITENLRVEGQDAIVALWDMEVWRPGGSERLMTKGMDILYVRGDQVSRDVVYYDRTQLRPLLEKSAARGKA